MPFGLGVADWDVLLTDEQLTLFFRQLQIINTSQTTVLALVVHFKDAGRVASYMEQFGFVDVHPFYTYKPQQNQRGTGCFIFAVEIILVGYKAPSRSRVLSFPHANPLFRHNLLFGHSVTSRWKSAGGDDAVNTTQKHPGVARHLASIFSTPGTTALVIGAGSGSDVIGCIQAGVNVVAVERCPQQFQGASARLVDFKSNFEDAQAAAALEVAQAQHLRELASAFTAWSPDDALADDTVAQQVGPPAPSSSSSSSQAAQPPSVGPECPSCGSEVKEGKAQSCGRDQCSRGGLHVECMAECKVEGCSMICCAKKCLKTHASEAHSRA